MLTLHPPAPNQAPLLLWASFRCMGEPDVWDASEIHGRSMRDGSERFGPTSRVGGDVEAGPKHRA